MPSVAIIYGIAEGPMLNKTLRKQLKQRGFELIKDTSQANVIITHSGGSLSVPVSDKTKVVLIVAPATFYRGTLAKSALQKVRQDFLVCMQRGDGLRWLVKSCINTFYLVSQPGRLVWMHREIKKQRYDLPRIDNKRVGVITHKDDPWSHHLATDKDYVKMPYTFINYDKLHDDIWINPQDYISVIQYLYES